jgi:hypothetical protein
MSRLWSALQAHYRPTAAYQASVVLIESVQPTRPALPVLSRGPVDIPSGRERGVVVQPDLLPPFPFIETVLSAGGEPEAVLGETVTLEGFRLDGDSGAVLLENERFSVAEALPPAGASTAGAMTFSVPEARSADFPAGLYRVSVRLVPPGEAAPRQTNQLAFLLAPHITGLPISVARDGSGTAVIDLTVTPHVRAGQSVSLIIGQREVMPDAFVPPANTLRFTVADAAAGSHLARLRVDGVGSRIIDRTVSPPVFLDQRITFT